MKSGKQKLQRSHWSIKLRVETESVRKEMVFSKAQPKKQLFAKLKQLDEA